jgi:hypothetical protein
MALFYWLCSVLLCAVAQVYKCWLFLAVMVVFAPFVACHGSYKVKEAY